MDVCWSQSVYNDHGGVNPGLFLAVCSAGAASSTMKLWLYLSI